jgi:hypothetical protein
MSPLGRPPGAIALTPLRVQVGRAILGDLHYAGKMPNGTNI